MQSYMMFVNVDTQAAAAETTGWTESSRAMQHLL